MTTLEQDAKVSQAFALQAAFKNPLLCRVAVAIVRRALQCNGDGVWPDDPKLVETTSKLAADDKNVVGVAWRWVGRVKLLQRGTARRRSTAASSNGREIAEWRVLDRKLAETFLKRHGAAAEPAQKELFA